MLKRSHIRQFLALVDAGSFTRAAERIGVTQPSLSAGVADLERQVGAKLFVRERRNLRLTDAGSRFLNYARTIERDFRSAEVGVASSAALKPRLRLGVLPTISTEMIAGIATLYKGDSSLAIYEGADAELRRKLSNGQLDGALTLTRRDDREHTSKIVLRERYRLMASVDHPLAARRLIAVADIAGETMIARRSCEILSETSAFFTERGVRPPFFLRCANDDRCLEMVRIGRGVTTAPESLVRSGVVALSLDGYDFRRSLSLVFSSGASNGNLYAPLLEACRSAAKA